MKKTWRWVISLFQSRVVILLYHRVFDAPLDPQLLCVSPKRFTEHMEHLRRQYAVISLRQLLQGLEEGRVPKRAVVVTFDDGYADNLWNARPVLERYEVPATVFVTAGYMDRDIEFWWDEVERLLLHPGRLPPVLSLYLNGEGYRWDLDEATHYSLSDFEHHRGWHVEMKEDPTRRHRTYRGLCRLLRPLPETERSQVLNRLREWAGVDGKARPEYRALSRSELLELAHGGLVEIGSHTMTHSLLSALPTEEQQAEIEGSKRVLEDMLRRPVVHFAYPYGSRADYTPDTVSLVRKAGFSGACSNFGGAVGPGSDSFQLPRFLVRNWPVEEFARRLCWWFRE